MAIPNTIRIYHIVHVDRLASIIGEGFLWSDADVRLAPKPGTTVGMQTLKDRRLGQPLASRPGLMVGACVPFYFCPRSVMLYLLHRGNLVAYKGGQEPIVHLVIDLHDAVAWAEENELRWAFTLTNAASSFFEDRADLAQLGEIDWEAVKATDWRGAVKDRKQAEFLVERHVPWSLVRGVGVQNERMAHQVARIISEAGQRTPTKAFGNWYY
jgi:hypothetical protein